LKSKESLYQGYLASTSKLKLPSPSVRFIASLPFPNSPFLFPVTLPGSYSVTSIPTFALLDKTASAVLSLSPQGSMQAPA
jgi:hypothetical protein